MLKCQQLLASFNIYERDDFVLSVLKHVSIQNIIQIYHMVQEFWNFH